MIVLSSALLIQSCGFGPDPSPDGDAGLPDGDSAEYEPDIDPEQEAEPERTGTHFRFPLRNEEGNYDLEWIFHVDHDPASYEGIGQAKCRNYADRGFPGCYDGHDGTDYLLHGGFETMDRGIAFVYAAAAGSVTRTEDGNYDRCHIDSDNLGAGNISCDGHPIRANFIEITHEDGVTTLYYHLKSGSLLVTVGDEVVCGQPIAEVGSSGISSCPHLHFEVHAPDGAIVDPYAGPLSQPGSRWIEQDRGNGLPGETCPD